MNNPSPDYVNICECKSFNCYDNLANSKKKYDSSWWLIDWNDEGRILECPIRKDKKSISQRIKTLLNDIFIINIF